MRKGRKLVIAVKCDHCKTETETFVCDIEGNRFCRIQYVGHPPIKDCMTDYYKEIKNVQKKEKEKGLFSQEKVGIQKEEIKLTDRHTAIKKLDELKQFLKDKKQPSSNYTPLKRI